MSKLVSTEETLCALERWQQIVKERADGEARLEAESRQRAEAERMRHDHALAKLQEQAERERSEMEGAIRDRQARIEAWGRTRAITIRNRQRGARKAALDAIAAAEDKRKYELQRDMLRTARDREEGLAAAEARRVAFRARWEEAGAGLQRAEFRARELTSAYGATARRRLDHGHEGVSVDQAAGEETLLELLNAELSSTQGAIDAFGRRFLPRLSRLWPVGLMVLLSPLLLVPILQHFGVGSVGYREAAMGVAGIGALGLLLHFIGRSRSWPEVGRIAAGLGRARVLHQVSEVKSVATHRDEQARVQAHHDQLMGGFGAAWEASQERANSDRSRRPGGVDARAAELVTRHQAQLERRLSHLAAEGIAMRHELEGRIAGRRSEAEQRHAERRFQLERELEEARRVLVENWVRDIGPVTEVLRASAESGSAEARPWRQADWEAWRPRSATTPNLRLGSLALDVELALGADEGALGAGSDASKGTARLDRVPLQLTFPETGSLFLEAQGTERGEALAVLNRSLLSLLGISPPGRVALTIFDPVGLGQNFAGLLHLADEAEHLIQGRVWTNPVQFEERLGELNDHVEKVIQMYLRNEYATIAEYNAQAGNIAEKYHFLVIADFPARFTETAFRRLASLCTTGPRCGVYTLIHWNRQVPIPAEFPLSELRRSSVSLAWAGDRILVNGRPFRRSRVELDPAPSAEVATDFLQRVARANQDSNRVEVPFDQITPSPEERWSLDHSNELRVPIGRTGATKLQYLALGKGTRQHALIAGKTGSGKSTLFHVIITNLALWSSPDEVEFYLVDFKKGVEFKCYAEHRLPHARVVAIESDREFGLSVLQRVDEELKRRGDLFRAAGVQDLPGYRRSGGKESVPRVLLLIDEFQEFFVEEDRVAQGASMLLDRIVRQGRAFGVHVILGSQTLGGAYTVARTTLGQMVVRIALQCNEADALLIMDEGNPAPRLLSRPGEGIYNDAAGARLGNSPFQVVWLPDQVRDLALEVVRQEAERRIPGYRLPIVYEGDAPAEIRSNGELRALLAAPTPTISPVARWWLGAPNSIKGPTQIVLDRRASGGVLLVGQAEESLAALTCLAFVALSAQYHLGTVRFLVLDGSAADSPVRETYGQMSAVIPHPVEVVRPGEAAEAIHRIAVEAKVQREGARAGEGKPMETFVFIHGLQQFRSLRQEDEFAYSSGDAAPHPGAELKELIAEGGAAGVHVVVSCDSYNSVVRCLGRKTLGECGIRVLFQMSANDSASLMDNPAASRLGLHRALVYQEREAHHEIFRPYAQPDRVWWEEVGTQLRRMLGTVVK